MKRISIFDRFKFEFIILKTDCDARNSLESIAQQMSANDLERLRFSILNALDVINCDSNAIYACQKKKNASERRISSEWERFEYKPIDESNTGQTTTQIAWKQTKQQQKRSNRTNFTFYFYMWKIVFRLFDMRPSWLSVMTQLTHTRLNFRIAEKRVENENNKTQSCTATNMYVTAQACNATDRGKSENHFELQNERNEKSWIAFARSMISFLKYEFSMHEAKNGVEKWVERNEKDTFCHFITKNFIFLMSFVRYHSPLLQNSSMSEFSVLWWAANKT